MASELQTLTEKGLTKEEADLVQKWLDRGRPGISRIKADFLSSVYNLGYSCQQIHQKFPEYDLEAILWARIHFEWDKRRAEYNKELADSTLQRAGEAHLEGINFLAMVLKATHVKWRDDLMRWMAAPDREKPPEFLPTSLHQYMSAQTQLKEMVTPPQERKGASAETPMSATGLPSIHIHNHPGGKVEVGSDQVIDVKDALKKRLEAKNPKKDT